MLEKISDVSKARKEIYLGEALRRLLTGRKESLTTVVNLIAERYLGIVERADAKATTVREDDVYRAVIREHRRPLEAREIASFPSAVEDWMRRNPQGKDEEHYASALAGVKARTFVELCALIDRLEKSP
jgi:hypothetical protein